MLPLIVFALMPLLRRFFFFFFFFFRCRDATRDYAGFHAPFHRQFLRRLLFDAMLFFRHFITPLPADDFFAAAACRH